MSLTKIWGRVVQNGRTLVIGDIHGCALTFKRLLELVSLDKRDTLYLLGDMIDRGTDSREVIDTILDLQSNGFNVKSIAGNHEKLMLLAIGSGVFEDLLQWLENGGTETLNSYGVDLPSSIPKTHLQFLESLPLYRITDEFVFVHAGIDCTLNDPFSQAGEHHMLWDRTGIVDSGKLGGRRVVAGHNTRKLDDIKKGLPSDLVRVDGGVYLTGVPEKGNLVCVDLDSNKVFWQRNIDIIESNIQEDAS